MSDWVADSRHEWDQRTAQLYRAGFVLEAIARDSWAIANPQAFRPQGVTLEAWRTRLPGPAPVPDDADRCPHCGHYPGCGDMCCDDTHDGGPDDV